MKITNWRGFSPRSIYDRSTDDFFNNRYRMLLDMEDDFTPAINTCEKKDSYEIEVAAPGLKKEDFEITLNNGVLTISSDNKREEEINEKGYTRREFNYSSFSRSFTLPTDIDDEHISANYENGVLHVHLPREVDEEENEATRSVPVK